MSMIAHRLAECKREGRKALAAYLMAGAPDLKTTGRLMAVMADAGVTLLELGMPFSDPMADGPVIQRAGERALKNGVTIKDVLRLVRDFRLKRDTPVLLMGYYNPVFKFGLAKFARESAHAGVDGVLIVDLPPEEAGPLHRELRRSGLDMIFLLSPMSTPARIKQVARLASGFVYYVTLTGITGATHLKPADVERHVGAIKRIVKAPVLAGFGIRTPAQARAVAKSADGVVVGSAFLELIEKTAPRRLTGRIRAYTGKLVKSLPRF